MRIAERLIRRGLIAASLLAIAGCAMLPMAEPVTAKDSKVVAASTAAPAAPPAAAGAKAPAVAAAPVPPALSPAAQLQYEQAHRSLAAGRLDEAERVLSQLTQSNPEFAPARAHLGAMYRKAGKLEQAEAQLEQAAKADSPPAQLMNELGIAYRESGKFAKAREAYETAIGINPGYAPAHLNLGILLDIYLWDGSAALAAYERYLGLAGADEKVSKWIVELRNRRPPQAMASGKESQ